MLTMKFGIIGAMEVEVKQLVKQLDEAQVTEIARMRFHEGTLVGVPCVVVQCGVGKVNAALCAQILALRFEVTHIVNTGVAGSLNNRLDIGDIVVSTDAVHHDMDATNFGYDPGEVPGMDIQAFPADADLQQAALAAAEAAHFQGTMVRGRVASGDQFVRDPAVKEHIKQVFGADCCEMEGASIAQASWLNGIPFVILRAISDKADGSDALSYPVFERRAACDCAAIAYQLVARFA